MRYQDEDIEFANLILIDRKNLDDAQVDEWMNDPEHIELLKEFATVYQNYIDRDFNRDRDKEFVRLKLSLHRRRNFRIGLRWPVAVSVVILVGLGIGLVVDGWRGEVESPLTEYREPRVPSMKAELILATGESVILNEQRDLIEGIKETGIRNDLSAGLTYVAAKVHNTKADTGVVSNKMRVPVGGFYRLTLADGTRVWLNSATELCYPVTFTDERREVQLVGEAYFEVAHDTKHPFIVHANGVEVKVWGTEFNVNTYRKGVVQTVLVKGKVSVRVNTTGEEQMLIPEQIAEYREGMPVRIEHVDPYAYVAWKEGEFVFERETIVEIMERLCRWYDVKVVYADEEVKQKRFTGVINRYETIGEALRLIGGPATLRFDITGDVITVRNIQ